MDVDLRNLGQPDETRTFNKGRYAVFRIGGLTIGRSVFDPGWKWSRDNGPAMGLKLCPLEHIGLVLAGICAVQFEGGRTIELRAGQFFHVPPQPHDSWVVGHEQYIALHFHAADAHMRNR